VQGRKRETFHSPAMQREAIEAWAIAHRHAIAKHQEDLGASGGTIERAAFQAALARIERGETDGLVVAKLDRFARSLSKAWDAIERIQAAGDTFASVADNIDLSTSSATFQFNMLGAVAQFERDQIVEQWDATTARVIGRGQHITNAPPFGYARGSDGRLVPDPQSAPLVTELFARRANGQSWRQLCDWLNTRVRTTTGAQWSPRTVALVIGRETYLGVAWRG
jgi:DNA invertase Pin-like site-specific DNA recombinase